MCGGAALEFRNPNIEARNKEMKAIKTKQNPV
jgi:hypothetical protein